MNQPPGYPPGGPPYPGQGLPPGQAPQGAPQQSGGTQLMPQFGQPPAPNPAAAPYGAPPPQQPPPGYGPPPQAPQQYGQPPQQAPYGQPPPGYGPPGQQPPPGYGPPGGAPPGYGPPQQQAPQYPMQQYPGQLQPGAMQPQQPGGMNPYAAPQAPYGAPAMLAPGARKPTVRNAVMTLLMPAIGYFVAILVLVLGTVIGAAAGSAALALIGSMVGGLMMLGVLVFALIGLFKMLAELNGVTQSNTVQWWMMLIPFYSIYVAWIMVPAEVAKAKQMVGSQQPPRSIVVYIFLWLYALAADLNDIAQAMP